jgi:CBS domain-containing protein
MTDSAVLEHGIALDQTVVPQANGIPTPPTQEDTKVRLDAWANKYRGATVADLDLPPALSTSPTTSLEEAMLSASSHDYSHLTVLSDSTRSLLGYLPISRLKSLFETKHLNPSDTVSKAMVKFERGEGKKYQVITMETELWELEGFFEDLGPLSTGNKQTFAVVTDEGRKFVLGVVTKGDLSEFTRRRPSMSG